MCKVYTGYCGTSETEHGLCACTVDNPLAKARGLSLRTAAQTMLYLSLIMNKYISDFSVIFQKENNCRDFLLDSLDEETLPKRVY